MGDLLDADFLQEWLPAILEPKNRLLENGYGVAPQDPQALIDQALEWGETLAPLIVDTLPIVGAALAEDRRILLEGQLGVMRDLDWGHYPYVTSSSPSAGGACVGAGIPPRELDQVWGVAKAFSSSVGEGPFPTELFDETSTHLREVAGGEYGASTGRPRRCGWFDAVAVRTAAALSGIDWLALTKVDALDGLERIKVAVAYELDGQRTELAPDTRRFDRARPIFEEFPGWMTPTEGINDLDELPAECPQLRRVHQPDHRHSSRTDRHRPPPRRRHHPARPLRVGVGQSAAFGTLAAKISPRRRQTYGHGVRGRTSA